MRVLLVLVGLWAFSSGQAAASTLRAADDPRLQRNVTLRLAMTPLSDLARSLSAQLQIPIQVSPAIADRKITLVCEQRSGAEVMRMAAQGLMLEWTVSGSGYLLRVSQEAKSLEDKQMKHEAREAIAQISAWLLRTRRYKDETREEMNAAWGNALGLKNAPGQTAVQKQAADERIRDLPSSIWMSVAQTLLESRQLIPRLVAGDAILASSDPEDNLPGLSLSYLNTLSYSGSRYKPVRAVGRIAFNPERHALTFTYVTGFGLREYLMPISQELELSQASEGPLQTALNRWSGYFDASIGVRELAKDNPPSFPNSGYRSGQVSLADHMAYLAVATGTPIVADAYRRAASPASAASGKTVADYLSNLRHSSGPYQRVGAFRSEGGWLMIRHQRYWRLQQTEIAERLLMPLEHKIQKQGYASIDDYALLAGKLGEHHRNVFAPGSRPLLRFATLPFRQSWGFLQLWSALNPQQKLQCQGAGLLHGGLANTQVAKFRQAVQDHLWSASVPETNLNYYMRGDIDPTEVTLSCRLDDEPPPVDPEFISQTEMQFTPPFRPGRRLTWRCSLGAQVTLTSVSWLDRLTNGSLSGAAGARR